MSEEEIDSENPDHFFFEQSVSSGEMRLSWLGHSKSESNFKDFNTEIVVSQWINSTKSFIDDGENIADEDLDEGVIC